MRIALLEDDQQLADLMVVWLEAAGHNCIHFSTGNRLLEVLPREEFDLIILDWLLPDISGDEILRWIRENLGWQVPVVFVTQRDSQEDIVSALQQGADDYMIKPITPLEMLARITALGRRTRTEPEEKTRVIERPPYRLDLESHTLTWNDEVVTLTQKEFDLAAYLFSNSGQMLSRANILETVWGRNSDLNTRTVDIHISRLRKKLGLADGETGWRLTGIYNHGYRLERAHQAKA